MCLKVDISREGAAEDNKCWKVPLAAIWNTFRKEGDMGVMEMSREAAAEAKKGSRMARAGIRAIV